MRPCQEQMRRRWVRRLNHNSSCMGQPQATAKLIEKIPHKPSLPLFSDIFDHPDRRLPSRSPVWLQLPASDFSVGTRWRETCDHFQVTNHSLIADPTARVPGFDLPRRLWVLLNGFRTGQGHCAANHHTWGWLTTRCACVENYRRCPTLLTSARRQSFPVVYGPFYGPYTVLMMLLLSGWTVIKKKTTDAEPQQLCYWNTGKRKLQLSLPVKR